MKTIWQKIKQNYLLRLYKCPECGLEYQERVWAEKCQAWCKEHNSCNLEITRQAIKNNQQN